MFKLISTTLVLCALSAGAARAQAQQGATTQQQERQAQEQAERDRRQAEREQKETDKKAKKEPGTRCGRWKRGKA
jgi:Ni/Co efflux regulator RcnB